MRARRGNGKTAPGVPRDRSGQGTRPPRGRVLPSWKPPRPWQTFCFRLSPGAGRACARLQLLRPGERNSAPPPAPHAAARINIPGRGGEEEEEDGREGAGTGEEGEKKKEEGELRLKFDKSVVSLPRRLARWGRVPPPGRGARERPRCPRARPLSGRAARPPRASPPAQPPTCPTAGTAHPAAGGPPAPPPPAPALPQDPAPRTAVERRRRSGRSRLRGLRRARRSEGPPAGLARRRAPPRHGRGGGGRARPGRRSLWERGGRLNAGSGAGRDRHRHRRRDRPERCGDCGTGRLRELSGARGRALRSTRSCSAHGEGILTPLEPAAELGCRSARAQTCFCVCPLFEGAGR